MEVTLQAFRKRFTYDPQKDLLGKGGFGEVYKAYDNEDHLFVALKISQGTADDKYSLINEIKRFKKLNHPNIVRHIEAYEVNTGSANIHGEPILFHVGILEYADKGTLADLLKKSEDFRSFGNFGSLMESLASDIIDGLAYLHSNNIIHRDLKPSNILLFSEGDKLRAKITDFGIAKLSDATAASTQLVGTVEYMAPEYFATGNIMPASDVWSLGVMLLEALTGLHPFGKTAQGLSNEQIINNILNKDLSTATQNLHAPFKEVITRCLLRETNLRPQSANELKGLLQQTGDAFSERTQVIGAYNKKKKGKSEKKFVIAGVFLLSIVMVAGIFFLYLPHAGNTKLNFLSNTKTEFIQLVYKFDPVCGRPIDADMNFDTTKFDDKLLGFCSKVCKTEFLKSSCTYYKVVSKKIYKNDWHLFGMAITDSTRELYSYIPSSIVTNGSKKRVTTKQITVTVANDDNFKKGYKESYDSHEKCVMINFEKYLNPYPSIVTVFEFDCDNRTFTIHSVTSYDAKGLVTNHDDEWNMSFIDVLPKTITERLYNNVCGN